MKHIKKLIAITAVLAIALSVLVLAACEDTIVYRDINWLNPKLSFEAEQNATIITPYADEEVKVSSAAIWSGADFARTAVGGNPHEFVGGAAITEEALIAGGALRSSLNIAYGGDDSYYVRIVAFVYEFFDHARLNTRLGNQTESSIMVLWQNPKNGHWFNIIRETIGSHEARASNHHIYSRSHGGVQAVIKLDRQTVADFSELELFIVAIARPTRETAYTHAGYVVSIALELSDSNNHFHIFETMATASTRIFVTENE